MPNTEFEDKCEHFFAMLFDVPKSTFLEFVCHKVLGPAINGAWRCPFCNKHSLRPRPPHPDYKDRFDCQSCDQWGDAFDLLKVTHQESWQARKKRMEKLLKAYENDKYTPLHKLPHSLP